jgi:hypothetical protein
MLNDPSSLSCREGTDWSFPANKHSDSVSYTGYCLMKTEISSLHSTAVAPEIVLENYTC